MSAILQAMGLLAGGNAWEPAGITATGGTMHTGQANPDGTPYTWHVFPGGPRGPETNLTYDFDVTAVNGPGKFEYIMIGGGGLGGVSPNPDPGSPNGYGGAGGGGAGGIICNFESPPAQSTTTYHPKYPVSPGAQTASVQAYPISVGRGAGGNPAPERNGKDTSFLGLTAVGGGAGARAGNPSGLIAQGGGCGGGGSANDIGGANPTSPNQGGGGGNGHPGGAPSGGGGGGGGADAGGEPYTDNGDGGAGAMFDDAGFFKLSVGGITDNPAQPGYRYLGGGGGGGGAAPLTSNPPGTGGFGGGGDAGNPGNTPGSGGSADNWSGGGGGGAGGGTNTKPGGLGGQGMVFIRYVAD